MSILGKFEQENAIDRRSSARRRLLLESAAAPASALKAPVLIHDISSSGLLIETATPLAIGDVIEVEIPETGTTSATVVWDSGQFYGCRFDEPLPRPALSAALLRARPPSGDDPATELSTAAVLELQQLRSRVQQLTAQLDRLIGDLERNRG